LKGSKYDVIAKSEVLDIFVIRSIVKSGLITKR